MHANECLNVYKQKHTHAPNLKVSWFENMTNKNIVAFADHQAQFKLPNCHTDTCVCVHMHTHKDRICVHDKSLLEYNWTISKSH